MAIETFEGRFDSRTVSVQRTFGGHRFDDDEVAELLSGAWIKFQAESSSGNTYDAVGHLVMEGDRCRFELDFKDAPGELLVPDSWGGHRFSDDEKWTLAHGGTVYCSDLVSSRSGKYYASELEFAEEKGRMRIRPVRRF